MPKNYELQLKKLPVMEAGRVNKANNKFRLKTFGRISKLLNLPNRKMKMMQ